MIEIVAAVGNRIDVIMLPKVEGPWDIHYLDQLLAQLEARHDVRRPILIHALLETAEGVNNVEAIAAASPRLHGMSLGPADLAASRGMKTTRVGGGHPAYGCSPTRPRKAQARALLPAGSLALHARENGRRLRGAGIKPFYGPFGDFSDPAACEAQFRNAFLMGCAGAWTLHPSQIAIAKRVFSPDPAEVAVRQEDPRRNAGRHGRGDDRRQDAGRCDLEAGESDGRPGAPGRRQGSGSSLPPTLCDGPATERRILTGCWRRRYQARPWRAEMVKARVAKFRIGQVVKHRKFAFRGVIYDVDPVFANTEEWWLSIPEAVRPKKNQPFYHLFAENADSEYVAYVSEQNLLPDTSGEPLRHPQIEQVFVRENGQYRFRAHQHN